VDLSVCRDLVTPHGVRPPGSALPDGPTPIPGPTVERSRSPRPPAAPSPV